MTTTFHNFERAIAWSHTRLREHGAHVAHSTWQGLDMEDRGPEWDHFELMNLQISVPIPSTIEGATYDIDPNLPWAEDHFQERVGGSPLNPGDQYYRWPHWTDASHAVLDEDGRFTHTYMERFWPKMANGGRYNELGPDTHQGIRFRYGDLNDLVAQLLNDPHTRQAYLPVFFPEDTGAVHGGRVPCTLGYHFMMRAERLHCWYDIRSCDFLRHFRDDLYMAVRLTQWILGQLTVEFEEAKMSGPRTMNLHNTWTDVRPGMLHFSAHSLHVFMGDLYAL